MCNNENCEKNPLTEETLSITLDGMIDDTGVVTIPREEYAELIAESTILRVVEKVLKSTAYAGDIVNALRSIVDLGNDEPEDEEG